MNPSPKTPSSGSPTGSPELLRPESPGIAPVPSDLLWPSTPTDSLGNAGSTSDVGEVSENDQSSALQLDSPATEDLSTSTLQVRFMRRKNKSLNDRCENLTAERNKLHRWISDLGRAQEDLSKELQSTREQNRRLQDDIDCYRADNAHLLGRCHDLEGRILDKEEELCSRLACLVAARAATEREKSALQDLDRVSTRRITHLQALVHELEQCNKAQCGEVVTLLGLAEEQRRLEGLHKDEIEALKTEVDGLKSEAERRESVMVMEMESVRERALCDGWSMPVGDVMLLVVLMFTILLSAMAQSAREAW